MKRQKSEMERMMKIQEWLELFNDLGKILIWMSIFTVIVKYLTD